MFRVRKILMPEANQTTVVTAAQKAGAFKSWARAKRLTPYAWISGTP